VSLAPAQAAQINQFWAPLLAQHQAAVGVQNGGDVRPGPGEG
jgi:hypothetical protein